MGAETERALLARAEELADTGDLAERIIEIIGWARAARVDQEALGGLVTAVRLLDGDVIALFRAVRGRYQAGKFHRDTRAAGDRRRGRGRHLRARQGRRPALAPSGRGAAA